MNGDAEDDFMGAIKIKDGLFIGDEFSAQVGSPSFSSLNLLKQQLNGFLRCDRT